MFEEEVSTGCDLPSHELNAETHVRLCLFELNRKLLMSLGAVDRFIQTLKVAELRTRGEILQSTVLATEQILVLVAALLDPLRSHLDFKSRLSPNSS